MFAKVAPIRRMPSSISELDYLIDPEKTPDLEVGHLVQIPFRNKLIFGLVTDIIDKETEVSKAKLKTVEKKFLGENALSQAQLNFLKEISEFYKAPLGFILQSALPPLKKTKLEKLSLKKIKKIKRVRSKPELLIYKTPREKKDILGSALGKKGQTLIIVPEISNTKLLLEFLPEKTAVINAELGQKELYNLWHAIRDNEIKVVVGTRLALFMPWHDLETVIVDDESNLNHKNSDMAPRLHAREAAMMLAHAHGARCILATHTPSVESWYFARAKVYETKDTITPLSKQINAELIDMRDERRGRNYSFLSNDLREAMNNTTGDIFLFINRKGSSSYVGCRDCGFVAKCETCGRGLTFHEKNSTLECHFCRAKKPMFLSCPKCHGSNVLMYGAGTQLIENDLKKNNTFKREIVRLDADTENLHTLEETKNKIIIGTQIAWDKINWNRVTLMAFLEADSALFIPEYKMSENIWWQLRDAQFRLPPEASLFIQSGHTEHHAIANLASPNRFYTQEEAERRLFGYPPFNYLIRAFTGQKTQNLALQAAQNACDRLRILTKDSKDLIISDPLPFSPFYTHGAYWYALIIKTKFDRYKYHTKWLAANLSDDWKFDPNPANLLSF